MLQFSVNKKLNKPDGPLFTFWMPLTKLVFLKRSSDHVIFSKRLNWCIHFYMYYIFLSIRE
jgi:hypothetical protein